MRRNATVTAALTLALTLLVGCRHGDALYEEDRIGGTADRQASKRTAALTGPFVWTQQAPAGCVDAIGTFDGYYPGARGFGACNRGGAVPGTTVHHVTNLAGDTGPGSFLDALSKPCPKIIVFDVSGVIQINSQISFPHPCDGTTIAGETAPAPGIFFRDVTWGVKGDNLVLSHIYSAPGDEGSWASGDARDVLDLSGQTPQTNVWIQNISALWSVDEAITCYPGTNGIRQDVSFHQVLIAQALENSIHGDGPHSMASLTLPECHEVDNIRTVFLHSGGRNPRSSSPNRLVANVVGYNFQDASGSFFGVAGNDTWTNHINNIYVKGPEVEAYGDNVARVKGSFHAGHLWEANNILWDEGGLDRDCDNPAHNCITSEGGAGVFASEPFASAMPTGYVPEPIPAAPGDQISLTQKIIDYAGARPAERSQSLPLLDGALESPINRMLGTGDYGQVIDCVQGCAKSAGGWPQWAQNVVDHSNGASTHCGSAIPTGAAAEELMPSGLLRIHEWLISCQDAVMPSGWRQALEGAVADSVAPDPPAGLSVD